MTQTPVASGQDPETAHLEQLLSTNRTAFELFRWGYETGLAHSVDHEKLARIVRAMELNYGETKKSVRATRDFIDVIAHRQNKKLEPLGGTRNERNDHD